MRTTKRVLAGMAIALGLAVPAGAEPLEPERVADNAKWVLHLDFDALGKTELAAQFREKKLDDPRAQKRLDWVRDRYGIDLREDLHGLTLYGDSYERHQGIALLVADFDRQKTLEVLKGAPGYRSTQYRDYTLHTWAVRKAQEEDGDDGKCDKDKEAKREKKDSDKKKGHARSKAKDRKDHGHSERHHAFTMTAALHENVVVLASDPERVKKALDVLDDRKGKLAKDSPLLGKRPDGTVFYGAAVDLADLEKWKGMFDFSVLLQGERVTVAVGEKDGEAFKQVHFVAQSEDVARKLAKVLQGFQAMLQLHAETKPHLKKIGEGLQWNVEGKAVTVNWKSDANAVIETVEHMKQRAKRMERWEERFEDKWEKDHHGKDHWEKHHHKKEDQKCDRKKRKMET